MGNKLALTPCYRKCYKCGSTSTNIEENKCKCGNYMHLISQIYAPKGDKT